MRIGLNIREYRIERWSRRADLGDGNTRLIRRTAAAAPAANTRGRLASAHTLTACDRAARAYGIGNTGQRTACLGPLEVPLIDEWAISIHLQINVIGKSERDGVLNREVKFAGAQQTLRASRVVKTSRRYRGRLIGTNENRPARLHRRNILRETERRCATEAESARDKFSESSAY